ncbi:MAG TPA: hypothetical protein VNV43_12690 [Candidatus Acidoferrales bacterium]|jgi:hypothetical protein|nr:hypothetical protein [Candidatus Acidoferrales bacterium]
MRSEAQQAIDFTRDKIRVKEQEILELKKMINRFYVDEGEPAPYADAQADSTASFGQLRTDHFYGMTLADAGRTYLEMRKAKGLGAASVNDIYKTLKEGGYAFDTQNEEYAKNGVRISLKKNAAIFHKLPNGDYGLCLWYGVKGKNTDTAPARRQKPKRHKVEPKHEKKSPEEMLPGATVLQKFTIPAFETFVREKNRRITGIMGHFDVTEEQIKNALEPASKVYLAERGWLMLRRGENGSKEGG